MNSISRAQTARAVCILIFVSFFNTYALSDQPDISNQIEDAIRNGVDYLEKFQLETGGFENETTNDLRKEYWILERTNAVPSYVLLSIRYLKGGKAELIRKKLVDFLMKNKEPPGVWRYWEPEDRRYRLRSPDSDDTAVAWIGLWTQGLSIPDNVVSYLKLFRGPDGKIWTWIDKKIFRFDKAAEWYLNSVIISLIHGHSNDANEVDVIPWNDSIPRAGDVDAVVNINILLMFALAEQSDEKILSFVVDSFTSGEFKKGSLFYPSPRAFTQALMRAYWLGKIKELEPLTELVQEYLLEPENCNFSDDPPMETALTLAALIYSGYKGDEIRKGIEKILKLQRENGSWPSSVCWRGDFEHQHCMFRSKAYTTALCLEVLDMYLNQRLEN